MGLTACTIPIPEVGVLPEGPALSVTEQAELEALRPALPSDGTDTFSIPSPDDDVGLPEARGGMLPVTEEMAAAMRAVLAKDYDTALWAAEAAERIAPDDLGTYLASVLRSQVLLVTGRPADSLAALEKVEEREIALFGNNLDTLTRRAEIRLWSSDNDGAIALYARVLIALEHWQLPTFFLLPPVNAVDAAHIWIAQFRSYVGISAAYILKGDYAAAYAWAEAGEARMLDWIGVLNNPIYGLFVEPAANTYMAHGWNLAMLAGARAGYSRDLEANRFLFEAAEAYFEAGHFVDANLAVKLVRDYVAIDTGLVEMRTYQIGVLPEPSPAPTEALRHLLRTRPADVGLREDISLPLPAASSVRLPRVGERTLYGYEVTPELEAAGDAYLKGDGEVALAALARAEEQAREPIVRWHLSYLRAQVLIMMGQAADAEQELQRTAELEEAAFGTNLNARALRGEARMWLGDNDAAIADFAQVIEALGDWRQPTIFVFPPPDIPQMVALTRAHFRSYLGMSGALMLQRRYADALPWAEETERLLEEAFYLIQHELYGRYAAIDADFYYGRGVNLGILGAARMAVTGDVEASDRYFDAAEAYFDALGYAAGRATVDGFRVRALIDIGRADLAEPLARQAADMAAEQGLVDLVWQIEALRGEVLLDLGRADEAEQAFRRAEAAIDAVSGALASDIAKRRFGVGKEDITLYLVEIDARKNDLAALFRDLERGRARAFVDMLGKQQIATAGEAEIVARIRDIDHRIRRQRLLNAAPGGATREGLEAETALRDERRREVALLRERDPELAEVLSISTRELSDVQKHLSPGEVIAYALPPAAGPDVRMLIVERTRARLVTTELTWTDLAEHMEPFYTDDPFDRAADQKSAADAMITGLGLADWGARRLLNVVPSGDLYFVPWGALEIDYPVVVLPTGGWLNRSPRIVTSERPASVVGDPETGGLWPLLTGARQEARNVGQQYGVAPLIGRAGTETALRENIGPGVDVLHLATHGFFDPTDPLESAIILSTGNQPWHLTATNIFADPLNAKLVVLSACETGIGEVVAGDDFLGLARSFYLGGALAVMNSLWPVYDKPTRLFMEEFHRHAIEGDYGEAWLRARDLLKEMGMPPSVYGAFVLGGSAKG